MTFLSVDQLTGQLPDIALIGKRRSGKDTVFLLLEKMGFNVKRVAFGDPLREKFSEMFPHIPLENPKPVKELIIFGQAMREIDEDIWVKHTIGNVRFERQLLNNHGITPSSLIFTDVRQPNEIEACKALGAITVRVLAPEEVRVKRMLKGGETVTRDTLDAYTETALDDYETDYKIYNAGSEEDLAREVLSLVFKIQSKR